MGRIVDQDLRDEKINRIAVRRRGITVSIGPFAWDRV
jgi:hypothetical protein